MLEDEGSGAPRGSAAPEPSKGAQVDKFRRRQRVKRFAPIVVAVLLLGILPRLVTASSSWAHVGQVGQPTTFTAATSSSPKTTLPTGAVTGDVLVSMIETPPTSTVTCGWGWTKRVDAVDGVATRVVACTTTVHLPQAQPAAVITPASAVSMVTTAYRNVDLAAPIGASATNLGYRSPSVTVSRAGSMAVFAHASAQWQLAYGAPRSAKLVAAVDDAAGSQIATAEQAVNTTGAAWPGWWHTLTTAAGTTTAGKAVATVQGVARIDATAHYRSVSTALVLQPEAVSTTTTTTGATTTTTGGGTTTTTGGTTSTTGATTTTTTIPAGPGVNKAHPFSASSPFNTLTPGGTSWFDTAGLHTWPAPAGQDNFRHWWVGTQLGITFSKPSDPSWTFTLPGYDASPWHRVEVATTMQVHAPANLTAQPSDDLIVIVADPVTGNYVEVWSATVNQSARTVTGQVWATGNMITGAGVGNLATNVSAGVRASNFSWAAGMITGTDRSSGQINHALAVALPDNMVLGGSAPVGPYIAPASAGNGAWPTGKIKMGSKIGIPAGVAKPAGLSPIGVMVFDSLQKYGAYVGDVVGGQWPLFFSDANSIPPTSAIDYGPFDPLVGYWDHNGSADMEKIGPLLRVANYQP